VRILLLDNYDSFTYNLAHYLEMAGAEVRTMRNDRIDFDEIDACDKLVFSPGPGLPKHAGKLMKVIHHYAGVKPMLGVCLGFQAIVEYYHGHLVNQAEVKHGISEKCRHDGHSNLFFGIPHEFQVGLYHSWAADDAHFPRELLATAFSENKVIMAFEHKRLPISGVQFHPESILTEYGHQLVRNFVLNELKPTPLTSK